MKTAIKAFLVCAPGRIIFHPEVIDFDRQFGRICCRSTIAVDYDIAKLIEINRDDFGDDIGDIFPANQNDIVDAVTASLCIVRPARYSGLDRSCRLATVTGHLLPN